MLYLHVPFCPQISGNRAITSFYIEGAALARPGRPALIDDSIFW